MIKFSFYVPVTHVDSVKEALFAAGAGQVGLYGHCAWQTLGQGQFQPLPGSSPFVGEQGKLTQIDEYLVEMVCDEAIVADAVSALRRAHPYEEPAFGLLPMLNLGQFINKPS